jgi:uncharacterized membrane protein
MDKQTDEVYWVTDDELPRRLSRRLSILVVVAAAIVLLAWAIGTPPGLLGKLDAVGYAICHRIALRSFQVDGEPLPLCARCTGIYLGVMTSFLITIASGRTRASSLPPRRVLAFLGLFVVILGIDGVNSYVHLFPGGTGIYEPHNWLRLVTGTYCGIAMFNVVFPVFNGTVWRQPDAALAVNGLRELAGVSVVAALAILLVLSEQPLFLWSAGLLSTIGVVMMLAMIGTVLFVSVFRLDRSASGWRDLAIPLLAGLTIAFIQIGGIDIVRYALTGTWAGFTLGG